jgi:nucleoside-diphosphate-sugar epimerase
MSIFVIGGTGFIGQRVIRLLAAHGEEIVCMDIIPPPHRSTTWASRCA